MHSIYFDFLFASNERKEKSQTFLSNVLKSYLKYECEEEWHLVTEFAAYVSDLNMLCLSFHPSKHMPEILTQCLIRQWKE